MYGFGMNKSEWLERAIDDCLDTSFAGEWGAEPLPSNAIVLRATDIDDDGHVIGQGAPRSIPKSKLRAKRLLHGDILLEGSGGGPDKPVGRVALFIGNAHTSPAVCSNFFKTLRPASHFVDGRFLCRKLGWFYRQPALLALQQQTTGIINLKYSEYLRTRIELPRDITEQAMIAEVLDTLDTAIRQTEAIIEKLKLVKQGLLHDLLTRGINDNGELRPPQSEAPDLYKASALGWIPISWKIAFVREASSFVTSGSRGWAAHYSNDGSLFIRSQNVRMGYLDFNDRQLVRPPLGAEGERTRVVAGDLLVTITGNGVGNISHVSEHWNEQAFVSQHVGLIRFFEPRLGRQAMLYFLEGSPGHKQLSEAQYGQSKPGLSLKNLCELQLPIQLYGEQIEVAASLDKSQVRIDAELEYLAKLRQMKSGLMDDLVTGRVRVTPLLTAT